MAEINDAVLEFGKAYADYLLVTEIVAGGTGPAKFLKPEDYHNNLIWDTSLASREELPQIWEHPLIVAARTLSVVNPENRTPEFREKYALARSDVWREFQLLYKAAFLRFKAMGETAAAANRFNTLNSLKANYDFAGLLLKQHHNKRRFEDAQLTITGRRDKPSPETLDEITVALMRKLRAAGHKGTRIEQQMESLRQSFGYLKPGEIVPAYQQVVDQFCGEIKSVIAGCEIPLEFELNVKASELLGETGFSAACEYAGKGNLSVMIAKRANMTHPNLVFNIGPHEMAHFLMDLVREAYYSKTGDPYACHGTMCTSIACLEEGFAKLGVRIYKDLVLRLLGRQARAFDILGTYESLVKEIDRYAAMSVYGELYNGSEVDAGKLKGKIKEMYLSRGIDDALAETSTSAFFSLEQQNKAYFYKPFYNLSSQMILEMVSEEGLLPAFKRYLNQMRKIGPIPLANLSQSIA